MIQRQDCGRRVYRYKEDGGILIDAPGERK